MLSRHELTAIIGELAPEAEFPEGTKLPEAIVPPEKLLSLAQQLKTDTRTAFDYLISLTAVDFGTHFTIVCHLDSTKYRHLIVLKSKITDRDVPSIDSLSGIYAASEFYEREVYDMFGIRFNNHPDLKRLFLEDDYGFPLRKDFRDEINLIER